MYFERVYLKKDMETECKSQEEKEEDYCAFS